MIVLFGGRSRRKRSNTCNFPKSMGVYLQLVLPSCILNSPCLLLPSAGLSPPHKRTPHFLLQHKMLLQSILSSSSKSTNLSLPSRKIKTSLRHYVLDVSSGRISGP